MFPDKAVVSLGVGEFVALLNQNLEYSFSNIIITGELANLRVSKGKWLYFDLKDDTAMVKFFGTVYQLPGPLENGMLLKVQGTPRLHQQYGFSVSVTSIQLTGAGTILRAAQLLQAQLQAEGLFAPERKRPLAYPPARIGLITSRQSAAYADFVKILNARWGGIRIELIDVLVQGEQAPAQIVRAIEQFNEQAVPPEVLVVIRGGGSTEDLAAFNTEIVTRVVAASRIPTLVAIGHEIDISLAELAADQRGSTPSNAAELLVPDRAEAQNQLASYRQQLVEAGELALRQARHELVSTGELLRRQLAQIIRDQKSWLQQQQTVLVAFDPTAVLRRGYAIVRSADGKLIRRANQLELKASVSVELSAATFTAKVIHITPPQED